jgi:phosphotransferase system enzyme I (PtsP)
VLELLRRIVQDVSTAIDLRHAFQSMVEDVREATDTQSCSLYLVDKKSAQFVLAAGVGVNTEVIGELRVDLESGILGQIGKRGELINLEDAPTHPNFYYAPEVGEEKYRAFLGVPIIHQRQFYGVLMIQQEEMRRFGAAEEAFLVTVSVQLATVIAHAQDTGELASLIGGARIAPLTEEPVLLGIASVPGVALGTAVVVFPPAELDAVPDRSTDDIDSEIALFNEALEKARDEITELGERLQKNLPAEESALFDVYLKILSSSSLTTDVTDKIKQGQWAQGALRKTIKDHVSQFEAMEDDYFRERATDVRDLGRRVLAHLQEGQENTILYPAHTILVGDEVTAAAIAEVPEGQLMGVVSAQGSINSHVAIIARALGVPTVMGAKGANCAALSDKYLIVDGYLGQVYVDPSAGLISNYTVLVEEEQELKSSLDALRSLPAETLDGHRVSLQVNTGLAVDAGLSLSVGAEGVGLYRSEIAFMARDRFPTEEEQRVIYRQLLNAFAPRPVVMRTLDIGGDKSLEYFPVVEDNPFLGWRGIRITLDHPNLFLTQIRAMLRANRDLNNLQILLPMISRVSELDETLELIEQAYHEVLEEEKSLTRPPIGVMIEVPSAVYQARHIAKRVDFLSIGSNDLTQYMLAVDRNNAHVASLYDTLHPSVLQAMQDVVLAGHSEGKRVGICGEIAADPLAVLALLAMGFDSFSLNSVSLPRIKWVIRNVNLAQARRLLNELLMLEDAAPVRFQLEQALEHAGLGGLIRAGRR